MAVEYDKELESIFFKEGVDDKSIILKSEDGGMVDMLTYDVLHVPQFSAMFGTSGNVLPIPEDESKPIEVNNVCAKVEFLQEVKKFMEMMRPLLIRREVLRRQAAMVNQSLYEEKRKSLNKLDENWETEYDKLINEERRALEDSLKKVEYTMEDEQRELIEKTINPTGGAGPSNANAEISSKVDMEDYMKNFVENFSKKEGGMDILASMLECFNKLFSGQDNF